MSAEHVAETFDALCEGRTGPDIVELVLERHPGHRTDPLLDLFRCTYAKVHGGNPRALHEAGQARTIRDFVYYEGSEKGPRDLPDYFVRCLLPMKLEGPA